MYTHFKKGKNCIKIVILNRASAIFFDCPACRMVTLASPTTHFYRNSI
jgi:hypothetical protein